MVDFSLVSFGTIALALFVAELTDKDAFLLLAVSTRVRTRVAFSAGATAFVITTTIIMTAGSLLVAVVPVLWIRVAGGVVMIAYGLWEARGIIGERAVEAEESRIERAGSPLRVFLAMVIALAALDLAGDATEVLTIVMVARYSNFLLVFTGTVTGLVAAVAVETTLGSRLGRLLTPRRLRYVSVVVFVVLGAIIILSSG